MLYTHIYIYLLGESFRVFFLPILPYLESIINIEFYRVRCISLGKIISYPMTELQLTQQCAIAFNHQFPNFRDNLYRIKNELDNHPRKSNRDKMIQLAENKATGVKNGISDFVLIDKDGNSNWIELKLPNEKQSSAQIVFQSIVKKYHVCYSVEEFIYLCKLILN